MVFVISANIRAILSFLSVSPEFDPSLSDVLPQNERLELVKTPSKYLVALPGFIRRSLPIACVHSNIWSIGSKVIQVDIRSVVSATGTVGMVSSMLCTIEPCDVLIVDDEPDVAESCRDLVKSLGARATLAYSLEEASRQLKFTPRVLLLDLSLPDGGGLLLLRRLHSCGAKTKVGIITGCVDADTLKKVAAQKPDGIFLKPYDAMKLKEWVGKCLGK